MKYDMLLYLGLKMLAVHNQIDTIGSLRKSAQKSQVEEGEEE